MLNKILSSDAIKFMESHHKQYVDAAPFPHCYIDNFLKKDIADKIVEEFPSKESDFWYEYNNPIEQKLASDDIRKFPPVIATVIHVLNSESFVGYLEKLTGIKGLSSDPYLHGGGLHCTKKGGKLDIHLDYSIHPKLNLERRLNLILYLTPNWKKEWGGNLELWNKDMIKCEERVMPLFNRAALFNTDDISFHGHPDPLNIDEDKARCSIALYYLTTPRRSANPRSRAHFFARPSDPKDKEIEEFRQKRSKDIGVYK
jgi:Rps23 Pro-64 3,4-dihydroxylase Tpa1-like proline 4-hydroxylase